MAWSVRAQSKEEVVGVGSVLVGWHEKDALAGRWRPLKISGHWLALGGAASSSPGSTRIQVSKHQTYTVNTTFLSAAIPNVVSYFFWSPSSRHLLSMPVDSTLYSLMSFHLLSGPYQIPYPSSGPWSSWHFTSPCMGVWQLWNLLQTPQIHRELGPKFRPYLFLKISHFLLHCSSQGTLEVILFQSPKGKMTKVPLLWRSSSGVLWRNRRLNLFLPLLLVLPFSPTPRFPIISFKHQENVPPFYFRES